MKMHRLILRRNHKPKSPKSRKAAIGRKSALSGSIAVLAASLLSISSAPSSKAATFYWDQDIFALNNVLTGGGLGGLGTWNTTASQ